MTIIWRILILLHNQNFLPLSLAVGSLGNPGMRCKKFCKSESWIVLVVGFSVLGLLDGLLGADTVTVEAVELDGVETGVVVEIWLSVAGVEATVRWVIAGGEVTVRALLPVDGRLQLI